jgi:tetratricopeptide (TPR) repeat protein
MQRKMYLFIFFFCCYIVSASYFAYALEASNIENDPDFWINQSIILGKSGNYTESLNMIEFAIKLDPNGDWAWNTKGVTMGKLNRQREALVAFSKAVDINPSFANYVDKGSAAFQYGKYAIALESYNHALMINASDPYVWYDKGVTLEKQKKYVEAINAYDTALNLNPSYIKAYYGKGISLRALNRFQDALDTYDNAIKINSTDPSLWNSRGNILRDLDRNEDALQSYEQAIGISPTYALAWRNKGNLLYSLKREDEAKIACERAKEYGSDINCRPFSKTAIIIILLLAIMFSGFYAFKSLLRTEKTVRNGLKNRHKWWNRYCLPPKLYKENNYRMLIISLGWFCVLSVIIYLSMIVYILRS